MKPLFIIRFLMLSLPALYGIRQISRDKRRKKKRLELTTAYNRMMLQEKLSIEHSEMVGNRILGLDRKSKKLLVIDHTQTRQEICIPLNTVSTNKILKEKNGRGYVRKVVLELKHKRTDASYAICFFDEGCDALTDYSSFSRRALYWKNRIDVNKYPGQIKLEQEFVL